MGKGNVVYRRRDCPIGMCRRIYVYKNYFPKEPERIVYDEERVLKPIYNQLQGVNIDNVKIKAKEVVNATVDELQKWSRMGNYHMKN